jgi:hypothetical protein
VNNVYYAASPRRLYSSAKLLELLKLGNFLTHGTRSPGRYEKTVANALGASHTCPTLRASSSLTLRPERTPKTTRARFRKA